MKIAATIIAAMLAKSTRSRVIEKVRILIFGKLAAETEIIDTSIQRIIEKVKTKARVFFIYVPPNTDCVNYNTQL